MGERTVVACAKGSFTLYDEAGNPTSHASVLSLFYIFHNKTDNTFRIVGRNIRNQEMVLEYAILGGLKYMKSSDNFHQWRDNTGQTYGLNFSTVKDAEKFSKAMYDILESLKDSNANLSQTPPPPPKAPPPPLRRPSQPAKSPVHLPVPAKSTAPSLVPLTVPGKSTNLQSSVFTTSTMPSSASPTASKIGCTGGATGNQQGRQMAGDRSNVEPPFPSYVNDLACAKKSAVLRRDSKESDSQEVSGAETPSFYSFRPSTAGVDSTRTDKAEVSLVSTIGSVMLLDEDGKKWNLAPNSSISGLSIINIYCHLADKTYRIVGRTDECHLMVLNCAISGGLKYYESTDTFHWWRDNEQAYGLNFVYVEGAKKFSKAMYDILESLKEPRLVSPQSNAVALNGIQLSHCTIGGTALTSAESNNATTNHLLNTEAGVNSYSYGSMESVGFGKPPTGNEYRSHRRHNSASGALGLNRHYNTDEVNANLSQTPPPPLIAPPPPSPPISSPTTTVRGVSHGPSLPTNSLVHLPAKSNAPSPMPSTILGKSTNLQSSVFAKSTAPSSASPPASTVGCIGGATGNQQGHQMVGGRGKVEPPIPSCASDVASGRKSSVPREVSKESDCPAVSGAETPSLVRPSMADVESTRTEKAKKFESLTGQETSQVVSTASPSAQRTVTMADLESLKCDIISEIRKISDAQQEILEVIRQKLVLK